MNIQLFDIVWWILMVFAVCFLLAGIFGRHIKDRIGSVKYLSASAVLGWLIVADAAGYLVVAIPMILIMIAIDKWYK